MRIPADSEVMTPILCGVIPGVADVAVGIEKLPGEQQRPEKPDNGPARGVPSNLMKMDSRIPCRFSSIVEHLYQR